MRRFLAVFGDPAIRQTLQVNVDINGNRFVFSATRTLSEGWLEFYKPYAEFKDATFPTVMEGQLVEVKRVVLKDNFTKPPARYNPRSLLMKMEKEEIGTKATRAGIIQTLFERKYLSGTTNLAVSDLGSGVIEILEKFCPTVISPELTRHLEVEMNQIQEGTQTQQAVLQSAVEILKPVISELKGKPVGYRFTIKRGFAASSCRRKNCWRLPKMWRRQTGDFAFKENRKTFRWLHQLLQK